MRITIDFERPPLRAVYRSEMHVERVSDPLTAAAQAGAMLQLSESTSVRILTVAVERTVHTPRPIGGRAMGAADMKPDAGPCPICGRKMEIKGETLRDMYVSHRCPDSVLRAKDGAHRRGDEPHPLADPTNRPQRQKRNAVEESEE